MKRTFIPVAFAALCLCIASCGGNNEKTASTEGATGKVEMVELGEVTTPDEALARLAEGNARYVADKPMFPHHDHKRIAQTAPHQAPFAAVVTCSDSRVPAELIFDQGIGDIFVIRTAGNSVNDDVVMGSVDYALEHLGVKALIVMGHESCGGVTGAIGTVEKDDDSKIDELLTVIQSDVKEFVGQPDKLDEAIRANTAAQVKRINDKANVKKLVAEGKTVVLGAYYNVHDGSVSFDQISK